MRRRRPAEQFYREACRRPALLIRVCNSRRTSLDCRECPEWENDPDHGQFKRWCRGIAEEIVAIVLEDATFPADHLEQDNERYGETETDRARG